VLVVRVVDVDRTDNDVAEAEVCETDAGDGDDEVSGTEVVVVVVDVVGGIGFMGSVGFSRASQLNSRVYRRIAWLTRKASGDEAEWIESKSTCAIGMALVCCPCKWRRAHFVR
jgi:hypothetical protein